MRCIDCGAEMRMLQVARDDTMMVSGYEHHTLECAGCHKVERRLVFSRAKRSPTGRNVQIGRDPDEADIRCHRHQVWSGCHAAPG